MRLSALGFLGAVGAEGPLGTMLTPRPHGPRFLGRGKDLRSPSLHHALPVHDAHARSSRASPSAPPAVSRSTGTVRLWWFLSGLQAGKYPGQGEPGATQLRIVLLIIVESGIIISTKVPGPLFVVRGPRGD